MIALHLFVLTLSAPSADLAVGLVVVDRADDLAEISARASLVPPLATSQDILPLDVELRMPLGTRGGRGGSPRIAGARVSAYAAHFDNGISLRFAQMRWEERPEAEATRWLIDPVIFGFAKRLAVDKSETIALVTNFELTFSLVQRTRTALVPELEPPLLWCGSGSSGVGAFGVELWSALRFEVYGELFGDPFHFGDGQLCLGDSPLWMTGELAGLRASWVIAGPLAVSASLAHATGRLHVDHSHDHEEHDHSEVEVSEHAAMIAGVSLSVSI